MKKGKRLLAKVRLLTTLNEGLAADTRWCLGRLGRHLKAIQAGEPGQLELGAFWLKSAVRTLFAQIEAISYAMRIAVVEASEEGLLTITLREKAKLLGRHLDKATGTLGGPIRGGQAADRFKLALKYFPKAFGSAWQPDLGTRGFREYRELQIVRNQITHPTTLEDLFPVRAARYLVPGLDWFGSQLESLMVDVLSTMGVRRERRWEPFDTEAFRNLEGLDRVVVPSDFYEMIARDVGKDLSLTTAFLQVLNRDSGFAHQALHEQNFRIPSLVAALPVQVACRLLVRTVLTEVEALVGRAARMILNAAERLEVALSDVDRQGLHKDADLATRAEAAARLFSGVFGQGNQAAIDERYGYAFRQVVRFRDRITHPTKPEDLVAKMGTFDCIIDLHEWYVQFLLALDVDPERVARLGLAEAG